MNFLKGYEVNESKEMLTLIPGRQRQIFNSVIYLFLIFFWYSMLSKQHSNFDNPLIYLFYLVPLLMLKTVIHSVKNSISPDVFKFNAELDELSINDRRRAKLTNVTKVIVDYPNKHDIEQCTLELEIEGQSNMKIDQSDAGSTKK